MPSRQALPRIDPVRSHAEHQVLQGLGCGAEAGEPGLDEVDLGGLVDGQEEAAVIELAEREEAATEGLTPLKEPVLLAARQLRVQLERGAGAGDSGSLTFTAPLGPPEADRSGEPVTDLGGR
ncbi:hypothetical protein [Streptomyces griseoluteus]